MSSASGDPRDATVVAAGRDEQLVIWVGFPLLGGVAGWGLRALTEWVVTWPWAPFRGVFSAVSKLPDPHVTIGLIVLGVLAGLAVAVIAAREALTVAVTPESITLTRGDSVRELSGAAVRAAFLDRKQLVLLAFDGGELAREQSDLGAGELEAAFESGGYTWLRTDPYAASYRRWVEHAPELPSATNAILTVRARAIERGDDELAAQLRGDLGELSIVVRDEDKRQFWRFSDPGSPPQISPPATSPPSS